MEDNEKKAVNKEAFGEKLMKGAVVVAKVTYNVGKKACTLIGAGTVALYLLLQIFGDKNDSAEETSETPEDITTEEE